MEQRRRKLMTMLKVLHSRDNLDRLYVSRKEGKRGFVSIEVCVDASTRTWGLHQKERPKKRLMISANSNRDNISWKTTETRNGKKTNCMHISWDKLAMLHTKRHGHCKKEEISREKLNSVNCRIEQYHKDQLY